MRCPRAHERGGVGRLTLPTLHNPARPDDLPVDRPVVLDSSWDYRALPFVFLHVRILGREIKNKYFK